MTDRKFFEKALGLCAPWFIQDVKLDLDAKSVEVHVGLKRGTKWAEDGELLPIVDYRGRRWRHLDTMQLETVIVSDVPRVRYPDGTTKTVSVPWAGERSRWTVEFEALAIDVIASCSSLSAAGKVLRLGWRSLDTIMARAVDRGLERRELEGINYLGLDEKSFRKRHRYGTLINDLDAGRVLEVTESKSGEAATGGLESLGEEVLEGVEAVAIDMSSAYENAIRAKCPGAAVVYDKFHVSQLLNRAVDSVRRAEHKELKAAGDESLKGTRYHWLSRIENMGEEMFPTFLDLVDRAYRTARAWEYKFLFGSFWEQRDAGKASEFFGGWFRRAVRSKLKPVVEAARTLKRHLPGLLTYFEHPITNAMSEGLNSRIEAIKNSARGFHGFGSFRTRVLFHLGGLDLKPR